MNLTVEGVKQRVQASRITAVDAHVDVSASWGYFASSLRFWARALAGGNVPSSGHLRDVEIVLRATVGRRQI